MIEYYTAPEVAEKLRVSAVTVKREFNKGKLNGFLVGNELRVSVQDLDTYCRVKTGQKTLREKHLEEEVEKLKAELTSKNSILDNIRGTLIKG